MELNKMMQLMQETLVSTDSDLEKIDSATYQELCEKYGLNYDNNEELEHEHEERLSNEKSPVAFITDFPEFTSPFWNMRRNPNDDTSYKVDVILSGMETFGSAEREVDKDVMRAKFETIMEGSYKNKLFE